MLPSPLSRMKRVEILIPNPEMNDIVSSVFSSAHACLCVYCMCDESLCVLGACVCAFVMCDCA